MKGKHDKKKRKAACIGKLFEADGSVVPNNKRYQVTGKAWAEIDSGSSELCDDEMKLCEIVFPD